MNLEPLNQQQPFEISEEMLECRSGQPIRRTRSRTKRLIPGYALLIIYEEAWGNAGWKEISREVRSLIP